MIHNSWFLGLDLSLRQAAAVLVPTDWRGDWDRVRSGVYGYPLPQGASLGERIYRCQHIAAHVLGFINGYCVTKAFIEDYAYGKGQTARSGELVSIVVDRLLSHGVSSQATNMGTARKLLLGKVPRGKGVAKVVARQTLQAAGVSFATLDEVDAFVCANWGMSEAGLYHFAQEAR